MDKILSFGQFWVDYFKKFNLRYFTLNILQVCANQMDKYMKNLYLAYFFHTTHDILLDHLWSISREFHSLAHYTRYATINRGLYNEDPCSIKTSPFA